jgi:histidyl-tRNA synthetase
VKKIYSNVRGTSDFSPPKALSFRQINDKASKIFKTFGYEEIILPMLEEKDLFIKGVGETTDIVQRQMFRIEGKDIVLRPEGTAQVVRYYLQNSLHRQSDFYKFFYTGAMFRGERPQKGRLRQFHHIGAEAIGSNSFYLDAEMIILCLGILEAIGVKHTQLKINTLGCTQDKAKFSKHLKEVLEGKASHLCQDCQRRLSVNPLRVIDCKKRECKKVVSSLSLGDKHLCSDCKGQFKDLISLLDSLGVKYIHTPYMVRGLDYYTNTVFEITSDKLGSKDAIGAGGRYNNLVKFLGGPDTPAIGFALGVERIILVLDPIDKQQTVDIFVAVASTSLYNTGFNILKDLREENIPSDCDYCSKSLKAQLRIAQRKNARFVVIVAEEEAKEGCVLLKDMEKSTQEKVKIEYLIAKVKATVK